MIMVISLRINDRLDGVVNLIPWKSRILLILHDSELWEIVNNTTANPVTIPTNAATKAIFDKKDIKVKRILLDAIKDHVIPHVSSKAYAH